MAQKKKKLTKKKRHSANREQEADSDSGDFELAAEIKDDDSPGRRMPRFPASSEYLSDVEPDTRELVRAQNKKKKKSGGFQSMGLCYPVYKGVMKKGYKVPTPIQRKTIPVILDGKDIVAMARTGSGKTAAFLVPMFEKLKAPQAKMGARALILTPTRELALQTMKFTKELGKFTGLKTALILGGDRMDDQFAALHENPDIIIGTPGRLMHVIKEMNLKLQSVEYVVFDEADRLFEMGFAEQLQEIIGRLPDTRQTLLFSATLPKVLVEFARAGLTEPVLIRLDVDSKLSDQIKLSFFHLRVDDKPALLLHLLRNVVKPQEQTVVFVATKHHVEYLKELLSSEGIECAYIYSALDQTARKINIGKFVHRKAMVLIVTDVAARGIDIPLLDNVINYNFPSKAKLFLHRVGRVGRAGRSGTAYSMICQDEMPFVYDLHLFLGRPVQFATPEHDKDADGIYGRVPQSILDDEGSHLITAHENSLDLQNMHRVSENAYKQYLKSRPNPSAESIRRVKSTDLSSMAIHPLLGSDLEKMELERLQIVDAIKGYKSKSTIFEINSNSKTQASEVMRAKRSKDTRLVEKFSKQRDDLAAENQLQGPANATNTDEDFTHSTGKEEDTLQGVFSAVVGGKRKGPQEDGEQRPKNKRSKQSGKDEEFYIPYRPKDFDSERGLSLGGEGSAFEKQASSAVLDLMGDEGEKLNQHKKIMKWDRKRKRFVTETGKEDQKKKIRTDGGQVIQNKKNRKNFYEEWKKKYRVDDGGSGSDGETGGGRRPAGGRGRGRGRRGGNPNNPNFQRPSAPQQTPGGSRVRSELKTREQILKQRKKQQKHKFLQSGGLKNLRKKNKQWLGEVKKSGFGRGGQKKGKMRKKL
ncbi:ATP-dependent RNA helicase DDX54 [Cheilinus undulatus]|uniref:ATP-dependent RNA helicase DDX54 n=1 Tax=Cheilinus undulatus TaxID=241271 RepID=UPI001BD378C3|nr:ATP-dependent RNA helicase DDX54 [Cheilinus undulatus]XP_041666041.1 ATP-dependent RNA helicase DDX54 [Cheilinus undulatus]